MYYYIFEQPQGTKSYERTAQVKEHLATLGIAGEMAQPSPGKTVADLIETAITKRYSTIIAVGGISLINAVAQAILTKDIVFGIIPLSPDPDIATLIGTDDWKKAAEQLKRRRWHAIHLGTLNGTHSFLTPASIQIPDGTTLTCTTERYTATFPAGLLTLIPSALAHDSEEDGIDRETLSLLKHTRQANEPTSYLALEHHAGGTTGGSRSRGIFQKLFGTSSPLNSETRLCLASGSLTSTQPLAVTSVGNELCQTPVTVAAYPEPLKLIVTKPAASS